MIPFLIPLRIFITIVAGSIGSRLLAVSVRSSGPGLRFILGGLSRVRTSISGG
jgi:hypothetical protein